MSKAGSKRVYEKVTCPHCNKTGRNNMIRYHFDKCKEK